jgi:hypothetical protein
MNNTDLFNDFLAILTDNINQAGKCIDEDVCRDIAGYITMLPYETHYSDALYDFIAEFGEDEDYTYLGRDEEGEKRYLVHNPDTHWHERIRKELVAIGYYKRYNEYWAAKKVDSWTGKVA